jgi:3D (Asp-Asp-Asp) domain-containing protein
MHYRKRNQIDLYMEKHEDAIEFGVKELTISWTEDPHLEQES